jgi:deoxyribodipyrimidine photo-lyase
LHNHARLWLASYLVHLRKVHWHTGAGWMFGHLLDGDLASNHLSWQWVAGTGSSKPYLFNAENVAKYAPEVWHSPGTSIDTTYQDLDHTARQLEPVQQPAKSGPADLGCAEPASHTSPRESIWQVPNGASVQGRDVWLVHPWAIGSEPPDPNRQWLRLGVGVAESHLQIPWSQKRWAFVGAALQSQTTEQWWGRVREIAQALSGARSVAWQAEPHADPALKDLRAHLANGPDRVLVETWPQAPLFEEVKEFCPSFGAWWRKTRLADID